MQMQPSLTAKHQHELQMLQLQQLEEMLAFEMTMQRDPKTFHVGDRVTLQIGKDSAHGIVVGGPHFDGSLNIQTDIGELHLYCELHRVEKAPQLRRQDTASSFGISSLGGSFSTRRSDSSSSLLQTPKPPSNHASPLQHTVPHRRTTGGLSRLAAERLATPELSLQRSKSAKEPPAAMGVPPLCLNGGQPTRRALTQRILRKPGQATRCDVDATSTGTGRSVVERVEDCEQVSRLDVDAPTVKSFRLGGDPMSPPQLFCADAALTTPSSEGNPSSPGSDLGELSGMTSP